MPKYRVTMKWVYLQRAIIEAEDSREALELVGDGAGEEIGEPEFSYAIDSDDWIVAEIDEKGVERLRKSVEKAPASASQSDSIEKYKAACQALYNAYAPPNDHTDVDWNDIQRALELACKALGVSSDFDALQEDEGEDEDDDTMQCNYCNEWFPESKLTELTNGCSDQSLICKKCLKQYGSGGDAERKLS